MRSWSLFGLAAALTFPAFFLRFTHSHISPPVDALLFGLAVVGAAFLLSWAAEVAQMDISQGLALAVLALITVLPEYAVDLYFAWSAGVDPNPNSVYTGYATANMTGANRLLVGLAWPLVILLYWLRSGKKFIQLSWDHTAELAFLAFATLYSFTIPLKGYLSIVDTVVLVGFFVGYMWRISKLEVEEPELLGPAATLGALPTLLRRVAVIGLTVFSAVAIFLSAEPFAESLISTGTLLGIDEFLLVQWLAPLASEAPEIIIVTLFTWHLKPVAGLGALVSSKVNQWTLLVGTIPLVFSIGKMVSSQGFAGMMPLDARQEEELFLTAAQSLFAVALLASLRINIYGALALAILFTTQLGIQIVTGGSQAAGMIFGVIYTVLAVLILIRSRRTLLPFIKTGLFGKEAPGTSVDTDLKLEHAPDETAHRQ